MKFIYCITDSYVDAFIQEAEGYSFALKCYCNCLSGLQNLAMTSTVDVLGYVIAIYDDMKDITDLVNLVNSINSVSTNTPVVLYFREEIIVDDLLVHVERDNIKLFHVPFTELFTDRFIKKEIFGTIIKEVFNPYVTMNSVLSEEHIGPVTQRFDPVFSKNIMMLTEPVISAPDIQRAVELDWVLKALEEDNDDILYFLRAEQLNIKYNVLSESRDIIFRSLMETCSDAEQVIYYKVIYNLILNKKL